VGGGASERPDDISRRPFRFSYRQCATGLPGEARGNRPRLRPSGYAGQVSHADACEAWWAEGLANGRTT